jgi:DNA-3-methyladenine glycosylase I
MPDTAEIRCRWCEGVPEFLPYHDTEWGFPVSDDIRLFEKLCLEGFQSGLSWRTILNKREAFREVFLGFDFRKVAEFGDSDVERLVQDARIIRHRGKISSVVNNAKRAIELVSEAGSLAAFVWSYEESGIAPPGRSTSEQSIALSKALKKRGWSFVGPTTVYAFMQAMGLVNDHAATCFVRAKAEAARAAFRKP